MQYYILTSNSHFKHVLEWLDTHGCWYEIHLNRTRFIVEQGRLYTEFMLLYSEYVYKLDDTLDLATGMPVCKDYTYSNSTGPAVHSVV